MWTHTLYTHAQLNLETIALETLEKALAIDPINVKALYNKGKLLTFTNEFEKAAETLQEALKVEPGNSAVQLAMKELREKRAKAKEKEKRVYSNMLKAVSYDSTQKAESAKITSSVKYQLLVYGTALAVALAALLYQLFYHSTPSFYGSE
eukprot:Colp12_sorted_trinity150504_noHs@21832